MLVFWCCHVSFASTPPSNWNTPWVVTMHPCIICTSRLPFTWRLKIECYIHWLFVYIDAYSTIIAGDGWVYINNQSVGSKVSHAIIYIQRTESLQVVCMHSMHNSRAMLHAAINSTMKLIESMMDSIHNSIHGIPWWIFHDGFHP